MTDGLALLRSVLEHPDEDLPRLVLADFLEESGQEERAAFVRVRVELARETRITYRKPIVRKMKKFMSGAITMRRYSWINFVLDDLKFGLRIDGRPFTVVPIFPSVTFSRGFISSVRCSWQDWLTHWPKLVWWGPRKCEVCSGIGHQVGFKGGHITNCAACRGKGELPGAMVECPKCMRNAENNEPPCGDRHAIPFRIPAPLLPTHQPIETVELTTVPPHIEDSGPTGLSNPYLRGTIEWRWWRMGYRWNRGT